MTITVYYVDGSAVTAPVQAWRTLRSDGVDSVAITNGGTLTVASASAYWLYPEGDAWVMGSASFRYDPNPIVEVICREDGSQVERRLDYAPDLNHSDIKLGWWWPGKSRPE